MKSEEDTLRLNREEDILTTKSKTMQNCEEDTRDDGLRTEAMGESKEKQNESDAVVVAAQTYSERYRRKMYHQLLESIDTEISTTNTEDLMEEYLNRFESNDSLGLSSYPSSSDDSNIEELEHCAYIDNYIKDTYHGTHLTNE